MEAAVNGPFGRVPLGAAPLTIGGTSDNQLVLADASISTHHAEIRPQGQDYVLIDLGSAHGTFLNERRLDPYVAGLLHAEDTVRIGDTRFTYEVAGVSETEPTDYVGSHQEGEPAYSPAVDAPSTGYGSYQPAAYPPPPPPPAGSEPAIYPPSAPYPNALVPAPAQPRRRMGLWIMLGAIGALVVIGLVLFGVFAYVNRSTPTRSLNAFCSALKSGDYQTAYNQLASGLQSKFGAEAQFAAGYASNLGLGKITNCTVTNVNDAAGTGTISNTFASGSTVVDDYTFVNESGTWKINSQQPRSTPTFTLHTYCYAITKGDYPTAYTQLSSTAQSQESEAQFAANFGSEQLTDCMVSYVNDATGTGTITYTFSGGSKLTAEDRLVNEGGTWKLQSEQVRSTPTLTLLIFCGAIKSGNLPLAYSQLSSNRQLHQSEAQFASLWTPDTVTNCTVSNVDDAAGTGSISFTFANGSSNIRDYTLIDENGTWKIVQGVLR